MIAEVALRATPCGTLLALPVRPVALALGLRLSPDRLVLPEAFIETDGLRGLAVELNGRSWPAPARRPLGLPRLLCASLRCGTSPRATAVQNIAGHPAPSPPTCLGKAC